MATGHKLFYCVHRTGGIRIGTSKFEPALRVNALPATQEELSREATSFSVHSTRRTLLVDFSTWGNGAEFSNLRTFTVHLLNIYQLDSYLRQFDRLGGARVFSKLDLDTGFHQIRVKPEDIEKTAFNTKYGQFEYLVLPMGLFNAPASFRL